MWVALSENLARLRKACDMSQEELAAAASVGVGVDTVGRIERGERRTVRPDTLARLAGALGTTPGVLVGDIQEHAVSGAGLAALREAVESTASIPGIPGMPGDAAPERPTERGSLLARGHRAWRWYVDGRHEDLLATLPILLIEMRRQAAAADGKRGLLTDCCPMRTDWRQVWRAGSVRTTWRGSQPSEHYERRVDRIFPRSRAASPSGTWPGPWFGRAGRTKPSACPRRCRRPQPADAGTRLRAYRSLRQPALQRRDRRRQERRRRQGTGSPGRRPSGRTTSWVRRGNRGGDLRSARCGFPGC